MHPSHPRLTNPFTLARELMGQSESSSSSVDAGSRHEEAVARFIEFWGEMATNWGINRTMAQIHALLYCADEPLNTDDIMERLEISRGNANMNLRSLTDWNLVTKTRRPDSRKDYYEAEKDVWHITAQIIRERERREIEPVRRELRACADVLVPDDAESASAESGDAESKDGSRLSDVPEADRGLYERIENLVELIEVFEGFSAALLPLVEKQNVPTIKRLIAFARALDATRQSPDRNPAD
jgi:DNA-binding transcriptional regulator GbsR (MarR family)